MEEYRRIQADINLDAIRHNIKTVQALNPADRKTLLVIKADAYGHGSVTLAKEMDDLADYFAVATMDEAVELRNAGIVKPILILGYTDESEYEAAVKNDITLAIYDAEEGELLSKTALKLGKTAKVHIKVDSGMSRIGFQCTESDVEEAMKLVEKKKAFR